MWRNIQLSFIDTHILIHWFIVDDHDDDSDNDDDEEEEGLYKKHKLAYIYLSIDAYICMSKGKGTL